MLDVADYADRLVDGLVNLVDSVARLIENPTRGILRLSVRYRLKLLNQVSSTTLIFFASATAQVVISSLWYLDSINYAGFASKVGEFASEAFDKSLGESLTATLIAATVVVCTAKLRTKRLEKKRNIGGQERARVRLGYYVAYLCVILFIFEALASCIVFFPPVGWAPFILLSIIVLVGPIVVFAIAFKFGKSATPRLTAGDVAATLCILFVAQVGGSNYASLYSLLSGACRSLDTKLLSITAVIFSNSQHPLIIRRSDILVIGEMLEKKPSEADDQKLYFDIKEPTSENPYLLLSPKQSTIINVVAEIINEPTTARFYCKLSITAQDNDIGSGDDSTPIARHFLTTAYDRLPISLREKPSEATKLVPNEPHMDQKQKEK